MTPSSPVQPLTTSPEAAFFLAPELTLHRQYEALRAYFNACKSAFLDLSRMFC